MNTPEKHDVSYNPYIILNMWCDRSQGKIIEIHTVLPLNCSRFQFNIK